MTDKTREAVAMSGLLEDQAINTARRNLGYGRPLTVVTADGIPWTVTGRLADKVRYGRR